MVPEDVVRRHVAELDRSLAGAGLVAEAFASVTVLAGDVADVMLAVERATGE